MILRLRACVWGGIGETVSGTTHDHDGGRVTITITTRPMGRIQATDLTSQMDPAKAFDGTVRVFRVIFELEN